MILWNRGTKTFIQENKGTGTPSPPLEGFILTPLQLVHYVSFTERNECCSRIKRSRLFFKMVQPAVRHLSTYIKMFVLIPSLRQLMLTSWHFGAGQDILGQKSFFSMETRWKRENVIFEFLAEQGIVSHLNISNVDIIYNSDKLLQSIKKKKEKKKKSFWSPMTLHN